MSETIRKLVHVTFGYKSFVYVAYVIC